MFKLGNKYENTNFIQIFNLLDDMMCMKTLCMYVVPLYVFTSTLHLSKIIASQYKAALSLLGKYILLYFKLLYKALIHLLSSISSIQLQ